MKNTVRILKKSMAVLTDVYKSAAKNKGNCNQWLTDNYYITEKIYSDCLKDAKGLDIKNPAAPLLCAKICSKGILPDDKKIISFLLNENLPTRETENLSLFIKTELIKTAAENITKNPPVTENAIKSLLRIDEMDFAAILYETSSVEKLLCQDPAGIYRQMTDETKRMYRRSVCLAAEKSGKSEKDAAVELLEKSIRNNRHIGFFLDLNRKKSVNGKIILAAEGVIPLIAAVFISFLTQAWYLIPLLYLPLWEALKFITDYLTSVTSETVSLASMDFSKSIPQSEKTVIALSTLLPRAADSTKMKAHLKKLYLSNRDTDSVICILADLCESATPVSPNDEADINAMKRVTDELNRKYPGSFVLAIRSRRYSVTEKAYTAHERKRGAITSLVKLIADDGNDFTTLYPDARKLKGAKYIMALDSDTDLPPGALKTLAGIASHPLNRPVISPSKQRVTAGYGIISPRMETSVESVHRTHFSFIHSHTDGLSSYSKSTGEKYQNLFGRSIFSGKGLIDAESYHRLLTDRFPEEQILSHDILEGIVLRSAFAGNVILTDSFPSDENSYFRRLHRWIRGDIQNTQLLTDSRCNSVYDALGRWWILDNVRRAITPLVSVICILCALFMPDKAATVATLGAVLSVSATHIHAFIHAVIHGGISVVSRLYFSGTIPYATSCILRAVISVITLVRHCVCAADAVIRSLFRMFISRKHMLEWTTAAECENTKSPYSLAKKSLFSVFTGILLVFFGNAAIKITGILFMTDLPFALLSSERKISRAHSLTSGESRKLNGYVSAMWKFYEKYNSAEHNYLIPDNVQFSPVFAVADRTSPTNIGLMLCAFLAARDFDFIDSDTLYNMLARSFDTIEKLTKYKGNLYNWYNTKTLEVLNPPFISTVDSGNFLCCLVAMRKGLEEYCNECFRLNDIIQRADAIINDCEMDFLYSSRRNLFHTGYDTQTAQLTPSYFDLLMSEARMTSYFAVASGKVPLEHWEALGRKLSCTGRYAGPVSWSGTMFEYFMPAIFLPAYPDTIGSEALRYCIHCQKKRVRSQNIPYGISESGYYAFDNNLNYSYKAHGVKWLSMRNDKNKETVISPYSTFLTLYEDPHGAIKNLALLEKYGTVGEYGFAEAVDFTQSRCNNQKFCVVNSVMSHHLGMSFLAAANSLFSNIFARRFISDDMMYGHTALLYEKIPANAKVSSHINNKDKAVMPVKQKNTETENRNISALNPDSAVFSNGRWTLFASDTGCNVSVFADVSVFRCRKEPLTYPDGIFAAIKYNGNSILPFTDAPSYRKNTQAVAVMSDKRIQYKNSDNSFVCTQAISVHPCDPCQINTFTVQNRTKSKKKISLLLYAEPYLKRLTEPDAHPAFSALFIETEFLQDEKALLFTRKTENNKNSIFVAFGFHSKAEFGFCTDREHLLSDNKGIYGVFEGDFRSNSQSVDKCIAIQLDYNLSAYSTHSETLVITAGHSREEAIAQLIKSRSKAVVPASGCARSLFGEGSIECIYAKKICQRVLFGRKPPSEAIKAAAINEGSRNDLWSTGISGDFPIVIVKCTCDDLTPVAPFVSLHNRLRRASLLTELIFITDCSDGYTNSIKEAVLSAVTDSAVLNNRGGIFIKSISSFTKNSLSALMTAATVIYPETENITATGKFIYSPISPSEHITDKNQFANGGYITGSETPLPWSHIICNRNFGTLVSNKSAGYSWALNSRENKLSPWYNDTRRVINGEMIFMCDDDRRSDLIKGSCVFFCKGKAEYYASAGGLNIKTTITVEGENLNKSTEIYIINDTDGQKNVSVCYYWEPALCDISSKPLFIRKEYGADRVIVKNIYNNTFSGYAVLSCDRECVFSTDKAGFISNGKYSTETEDCIVAKRDINLKPKSSAVVKFSLSYGNSFFSAVKIPYIRPKKTNENRIMIETPDNNLNNIFNNFLPEQIIGGRIFARTGFYQCSGAYGFRDQLQDAMAVSITHPEILKTQILRCCSAQFVQGDVLHWFHQLYTNGRRILRGVRTLYSDDLLWLPLAVSEYCRVTGDKSVLDLPVPYIDAPVLEQGEYERFGEFTKSDITESVYNHCINAITHACRFGKHSLALIGGGDWNDSFNTVGINGKGESIWLSMFLSYTLKNFASICDAKGNQESGETMRTIAEKLLEAVDTHAWNGDRYLRCFYDDGTPMGADGNSECAIDLLPQAWSVIAGMPDRKRCNTAIDTAYNHLVDKDAKLIKLFTPPFGEKSKQAGYVNRYPEGVRENGGQYTHGALWLAQAYFLSGNPQRGYELLKIINPAEKDTAIYKTEPYYLAGDVYSADGMAGRGGWSIYTGSAGWFYRVLTENMLGITKRGNIIKTNPRLPDELRESRVKILINGHSREFRL